MQVTWRQASWFIPLFVLTGLALRSELGGQIERTPLEYNRYDLAYIFSLLSVVALTGWVVTAWFGLLRLSHQESWDERVPVLTRDATTRKSRAIVLLFSVLLLPAIGQCLFLDKAMNGETCQNKFGQHVGWRSHLLNQRTPSAPHSRCIDDPHDGLSLTYGKSLFYVPLLVPWVLVFATTMTVLFSFASLSVVALGSRVWPVSVWARWNRKRLAGQGALRPSSRPPSSQIFLCHASPDKPWVRELESALEHNFKIWFDEKCLPPGSDFVRGMAAGVRTCAVFMPIFSQAFLRSYWAKRELYTVLYLRSLDEKSSPRILPVCLSDVSPREITDEFPEFETIHIINVEKQSSICLALQEMMMEIKPVDSSSQPATTSSERSH